MKTRIITFNEFVFENDNLLSKRMKDENLSYKGLINNWYESKQEGTTWNEWHDFIRDQYDASDNLLNKIKKQVGEDKARTNQFKLHKKI